MGRASIRASLLGFLLFACCAAPAAQAAYPGENGRIAFQGDSGQAVAVFTMNPDGSDVVAVTDTTQAVSNGSPAWSPDGLRIGYFRSSTQRIVIVNPDGTSPQTVPVASGSGPTWAPDGLKVAFNSSSGEFPDIFSVNLNGTGLTQLTGNDEDCPPVCGGRNASWSPLGDRIAYQATGMVDDGDGGEEPGSLGLTVMDTNGVVTLWPSVPHDPHGATYVDWSPDGRKLAFSGPSGDPHNSPDDIYVINADGSGLTNLTNSPQEDVQPVWSPDGTKIAFTSFLGPPAESWQCWGIGEDCNWEIHTMNADGSDVTRLTNNTTRDMKPSWQPVQRPYARPAGASPLRISLVPAAQECTSPNRTHGPPLAFGSCAPPEPGSPNLTVGVGDGSPAFSRSIGFVRFTVLPGDPAPPDDSDVQIRFSLSNVMRVDDLSDYTGVLQPRVTVRLTDRDGFQRQTTQDFPFGFVVPCAATSSTIDGGLCNLTTSADAVLPGSVGETNRAIWATDQVRVYDGGPTGNGANEDLFAVQGIFSP